jgi:hypothetical protein
VQAKSVPGFSNYLVTDRGEIRNIKTGGVLRPHVPASGLARVTLNQDGKRWQASVRDVVALVFLGPCPPRHVTRSVDGDVTNVKAINLLYVDLFELPQGYGVIPGYSNYRVHESGRVQSCKRSLNYVDWFDLRIRYDKQGYAVLSMTADDGTLWQPLVHRLVLLAFVGPCPEGMETRHLDGVRSHNWRANLCYGTPLENAEDKERHGTVVRGDAVPGRKRILSMAATHGEAIRARYKKGRHGVSATALAREYGVGIESIHTILNHNAEGVI